MSHSFQTDVVIIGAGPVGLFAVFECGMLKMKCHVVDALDMVGGQCSALYPEKPIYDIPGFPRVDAADLIDNLVKQADPFEPQYHLGQNVIDVIRNDSENSWTVKTSHGNEIICKAIIIAAGVGAFGPKRPPLQGIEAFEGHSVHYYVQKRADFAGKRIVIAGGGDSAVDWAISLSEVAEKVSVVHRRPKFRAAPESVDQMHKLAEAGKIDLVIPYQLGHLEGQGNQLSAVVVKTLDGQEKALEADVLLPFFGLEMNLGPINDWGLELEKAHIKIQPTTCETNLPGVYAVGDIATYENKLKLILTGFSECAFAAHSARKIIYPDQAYHFEYSTTSGVPDEVEKPSL